MQSIDTLYKKCLFRSRLEARWAVFFDSLDLPWDYEPEGFVLSDGDRYLPDFWLPTLDCFFEVKGPAPTEQEMRRAYLLSEQSHKLVVVASGTMNVAPLTYGGRDFGEWPIHGFNLQAFGGSAHAMWHAAAFDFGMWDWMLGTDLPPFMRTTYPDHDIAQEDSEERRRTLVDLDRKYYRAKYNKEHPRYLWGRHEKQVHWAIRPAGDACFAAEPVDMGGRLSGAYQAARSARFERR